MKLQLEPPPAAAVPTCDSIQSNRLLMYSGADMRVGFLIFMPSAHRYSYCKQTWEPAQGSGGDTAKK